MRALSLYHACIVLVSCVHCYCIMRALSLYHVYHAAVRAVQAGIHLGLIESLKQALSES